MMRVRVEVWLHLQCKVIRVINTMMIRNQWTPTLAHSRGYLLLIYFRVLNHFMFRMRRMSGLLWLSSILRCLRRSNCWRHRDNENSKLRWNPNWIVSWRRNVDVRLRSRLRRMRSLSWMSVSWLCMIRGRWRRRDYWCRGREWRRLNEINRCMMRRDVRL